MAGIGDNSGGASAPPLSPVRRRFEIERLENGRVELRIKEQTNVPVAKALAEVQRQKEQAFGRRRGDTMLHVARLPTTVAKRIAEVYGIDLCNFLQRKDWHPPTQAEMRRLEQIIDRDFPLLKTTEARFNLRPTSVAST